MADADDEVVTSEWTTSSGDLHFHDYAFDDYNTEIITLEADYDNRTDIKALDWEETHRKWTGEAWQLDFAALDTDVQHFLDQSYTVTIAAGDLSIFLSDYDAPFLEGQVPDEPPPDVEEDGTTTNRPISVRSSPARKGMSLPSGSFSRCLSIRDRT